MKNFLKWPGSKKWLTEKYSFLFPEEFNNYHEPFLGGGSVFFFLKPSKEVYLYDVNKKLLEVYKAVKNDPSIIKKLYAKHSKLHSKEYYYETRACIPSRLNERAARFLYLNRACFNGIYRENREGKFNVPIGLRDGKLNNVSIELLDLDRASKSLKGANLICGSYELAFKNIKKNDFVYLDPPYVLKDNREKFNEYSKKRFTWKDQVKLADLILKASKKGAKVMLSNVNSPQIKDLFSGSDFEIIEISRRSSIAALSKHRKNYEELILKNF